MNDNNAPAAAADSAARRAPKARRSVKRQSVKQSAAVAESAPRIDDSQGELISLSVLAKRVDVSNTTVWNWCFNPKREVPPLRHAKRNGVWKTKIAWYNEWLNEQQSVVD